METVAVLGHNDVFMGACHNKILRFWYPLIDIHFILLHVEFEDGLSIFVSKTRVTRPKISQLKIEKFPKKSNGFKGRPPTFYFKTRKLSCT
jgi:hypothetical protein